MPLLTGLLPLPTIALFPRRQRHLLRRPAADQPILGDCLVFEDGAFDDPSLAAPGLPTPPAPPKKPRRKPPPVPRPEELVPAEWREVQAELNISKKERRVIAHEMRFATRVEAGRRGRPSTLPEAVEYAEYRNYRASKTAALRPVVLDEPMGGRVKEVEGFDGDEDDVDRIENRRVEPRNPRAGLEKVSVEDIAKFFNSGRYRAPGVVEVPGQMFSKEERELMNKRVPNYREATSDKWIPLHTLAVSGEFYLVDKLMKHNAQINDADKDGLTALHKTIICKKQAVTNYLLRESANPFVRDREGATLLHYAVRTAAIDSIKILLLYDVDINLADDDGWTPLHLAVQAKRTDIVRLLLIKGADKTIKNKDGLSPLDLCLYSGRDIRTYELIKILKELPKSV